MPLEPFKYIVQVVLVERDENGDVIGERIPEQPAVFYSDAKLRDWLAKMPEQVAQLNGQPDVEPASRQ